MLTALRKQRRLGRRVEETDSPSERSHLHGLRRQQQRERQQQQRNYSSGRAASFGRFAKVPAPNTAVFVGHKASPNVTGATSCSSGMPPVPSSAGRRHADAPVSIDAVDARRACSSRASSTAVSTATRGNVASSAGAGGDGDALLSPASLMLRRPLALLAMVPKPAVLFLAGALAGAIGKSVTAPLDRVKILLQVRGGNTSGALHAAAAQGSLVRSFLAIGQVEGLAGYWRGNLPQVLRVLPYSAAQLYSYEVFKKAFADQDGKLTVPQRLAAGACAGMASTLVTYPLDTLRLRMAVDPSARSMACATRSLYVQGGAKAFFRGLGPALAGIAPYMALELAAFDLMPPDRVPSFARGFCAALLATSFCYPLDTIRRQIQVSSGAHLGMAGVVGATMAAEGVKGLYRGFIPNALKNLPNKGIRLSTFDAAKKLVVRAEEALQEERAAVAMAAGGSAKGSTSCCSSTSGGGAGHGGGGGDVRGEQPRINGHGSVTAAGEEGGRPRVPLSP